MTEHEHTLIFWGYEQDDSLGWEVWVCSHPGCAYEESAGPWELEAAE